MARQWKFKLIRHDNILSHCEWVRERTQLRKELKINSFGFFFKMLKKITQKIINQKLSRCQMKLSTK